MNKLTGLAMSLSLIGSIPVFAQQTNTPQDPMVSGHQPRSSVASNINSANTRTPYAPELQPPPPEDNESAMRLLRVARAALDQHRTGAAQEALERAESRLLNRSVPQSTENVPDSNPVVTTVAEARQSLGRGDIQASAAAIDRAVAEMTKGMPAQPGGGGNNM